MKPMLPLIALALATTTPLAHSAEVISADGDRTVGYGAGGVVGVMVGAALGGPWALSPGPRWEPWEAPPSSRQPV